MNIKPIQMRRIKQQGMSLIGMLAALVILGLLSISIYKFASSAKESAKAKILIDDVRGMLSAAKSIKGIDDVASIGALIQSKELYPSTWKPLENSGLHNQFETQWGIVGVTGAGNWFGENPPGFTANDGIHLFIQKVPLSICYKVLNTLQSEVGYISYGAAPGEKKGTFEGIVKSYSVPYSTTSASQACDDRSSNGAKSVAIRLAVWA